MKKIKKYIPLAIPFSIPILLFAPYSFLNQLLLVKWLGCGCPIDADTPARPFNANDFTSVFWGVLCLFMVWVAFVLSKRVENKYTRIIYILCVIITMVIVYPTFCDALKWN